MRLLLVYLLFVVPFYSYAADKIPYLGSQECSSCHKKESDLWKSSHHDLAMQPANKSTVLGDFNNQSLMYNKLETLFYTKDDVFFVKTEGLKGLVKEFEVLYTFGVDPLQQYLVKFADGRLQALPFAWDSRQVSMGGQRWFSLYKEENIVPEDIMHWTGVTQNWNSNCADCHSTGVQKNYDLASDTFETRWKEINVGCESCHGPGQLHREWALDKGKDHKVKNKGLNSPLAKAGQWEIYNSHPTAKRVSQDINNPQVGQCAQCHSLRAALSDVEAGKPFDESHSLHLITEDRYHIDGQIKDEVYVYGSFLQSKMYKEGVVCSNCHEPHSLRLKLPGNQVCGQCHNASVFDTAKHHHHADESEGAQCVSCHMPATTYMKVDPRRDHSFRVPRPDFSSKYGTPNACDQCHSDKGNSWSEKMMNGWGFKEKDDVRSRFSEFFVQLFQNEPGNIEKLAGYMEQPDISAFARASALNQVSNQPSKDGVDLALKQLNSESLRVRLAALNVADVLPAQLKVKHLAPLLIDEHQQIRIEVARQLAGLSSIVPKNAQSDLKQGVAEYKKILMYNAERPESHNALGSLYLSLNDFDAAKEAFETALRLVPRYVPAIVNLADLARLTKDENEVQRLLLQAIQYEPTFALAHYALALSFVRQGRFADAINRCQLAVNYHKENATYQYLLKLLLEKYGDK